MHHAISFSTKFVRKRMNLSIMSIYTVLRFLYIDVSRKVTHFFCDGATEYHHFAYRKPRMHRYGMLIIYDPM